jgi:hypothetical protein
LKTLHLPLWLRVIAYVLTLLPFDGLSSWIIVSQHLSAGQAATIGLTLGAIHSAAGAFALTHLTLPEDQAAVKNAVQTIVHITPDVLKTASDVTSGNYRQAVTDVIATAKEAVPLVSDAKTLIHDANTAVSAASQI